MSDASIEFPLDVLRRIVDQTFLAELDFHRELPSTNDRAVELASHANRELPGLVLAETQTAGRGRGANRWWSQPGALTFSLVLDARQIRMPAARWPQIALTTGLAVCEAVEDLRPGIRVGLKWPNDVYVDGRKLCGILVEAPSTAAERIVIGVGVNVNNSFAGAPPDIAANAKSLADQTGASLRLDEVLITILSKLATHLDQLGSDEDHLAKRWDEYCILTGHRVRVEWGERVTDGICRGIDHAGALIVETADGEQSCVAGVVRHFDRR